MSAQLFPDPLAPKTLPIGLIVRSRNNRIARPSMLCQHRRHTKQKQGHHRTYSRILKKAVKQFRKTANTRFSAVPFMFFFCSGVCTSIESLFRQQTNSTFAHIQSCEMLAHFGNIGHEIYETLLGRPASPRVFWARHFCCGCRVSCHAVDIDEALAWMGNEERTSRG